VLFKKMSADVGGNGNKTEYIGAALWDKIKNLDPIILSAVGTSNRVANEKTKRFQINQYLKPTPDVKFVATGISKNIYANPKSILIDDSLDNINAWEMKKGIGIKHNPNNVQDTINQLKKYFDLD